MIFQALEFTGESPFKHCLIHGLIRDRDGRKMSKSLGNGVDPIEIKEKYGMDTLRYFLTTNSAPGMDLRFEIEKVESSWNFINKLWNISRFVLMNLNNMSLEDIEIDTDDLLLQDKWILSRMNETIKSMDYNYEKFEFGEAARAIHRFSWEDFAAWYVEIAKIDLFGNDDVRKQTVRSILAYVLLNIMKLLHPFMPFVTEEIYQKLPHKAASIMIEDWPSSIDEFDDSEAIRDFEMIQDMIKAIRNSRQEYNVAPSKEIKIYIETSEEIQGILEQNSSIIKRFMNPETLVIDREFALDEDVVSIVLSDVKMHLPLGSLVDIDKEIERLKDELNRLTGEIKRCEGMLSNKHFVEKAPAFKVDQERDKLSDYQKQYDAVQERIDALEK
jgi:valyl-tRNA synthetase